MSELEWMVIGFYIYMGIVTAMAADVSDSVPRSAMDKFILAALWWFAIPVLLIAKLFDD